MGFFNDMKKAVETYPTEFIELDIIDLSFPGSVLNQGEEGSFKVQVTNRGALNLTDVTVKVKGVNGAQVKTGGAADTNYRSEFVTGKSQLEKLNAHGDSEVIGGSPMKFKAPGSPQPAGNLLEVTIQDWDGNLDHIMLAHSDPVDSPKATFNSQVVGS